MTDFLSIPQHQLTLSGNTAGALAALSSGTVTIAGGNNITVSQAGNAITISGANVGGAQTGISGLQNSETTYTSGTVSLSELGAITIRSTTGQAFQFSVNSQTVQTQNAVDVTLSGNTSGALALISSGTMTLAGGNNITLSQAGNAVTISGPNVGGAQTGISGLANSETTYTSGSVTLSALGAVTIRSTTGQHFQISVNSQSVQPETQTFIGGISASDTLYTSGTVRFTGVGGGVTVSSNTGQRVDISVAAQSIQPETQTFIAGLQNSETTYTSGTVNLSVVAGQLTIRSTTGQAFQFSASQSVQPETQTFIGGLANSETTYTSGSVTLSALGALTIRSTTGQHFQFSVNSQTVQTQGGFASMGVSTGGNTSGDTTVNTGSRMVFVGSNNITLSQGTAAGATTITISGPTTAAQSVQTQGILNVALSNIGNTAGDTGLNSGTRMVLAGGNNITLSASSAANATTITISAPTQTVQTQGVLSAGVSTGGNTAGNTTVNTGSRMVFVGTNMVSLSQTTGAGATTISIDATQSVQTQGILNVALSNIGNTSGDTGLNSGTRMVLAGGNNVTLSASTAANATTITISAGGGAYSAGMSTNGNTSGDTGYASQRLNLVGGNNITLSGSTNAGSMTITVSAPNLGAGAMSAGVSNLGNTAGSTGITGTQLVLVGSNNISLSQSTGANGGTVTINNTVSAFQAGMSTEGNTAGNTGVTGTRYVFVGTGPVSLSQTTGANGATLSINAPATSSLSATGLVSISTNGSTISIGVPHLTAAYWENMPAMEAVLYSHISGVSKTPFYWVENLPQGIKPANIAMRVSMVTANSDLSLSIHFGVYTFVNSTSAALLGSGSDAFHVSSGSSVSLSAQRNLVLTSPGTVAAISSLTAGNYLFGCMFSATATNAMNASVYAATAAAGPRLGRIMPGTNQLSTATSQGIAGLYGRGSTTVNVMPANVQASEVVNQGIGASSPMKPYIFIRS